MCHQILMNQLVNLWSTSSWSTIQNNIWAVRFLLFICTRIQIQILRSILIVNTLLLVTVFVIAHLEPASMMCVCTVLCKNGKIWMLYNFFIKIIYNKFCSKINFQFGLYCESYLFFSEFVHLYSKCVGLLNL